MVKDISKYTDDITGWSINIRLCRQRIISRCYSGNRSISSNKKSCRNHRPLQKNTFPSRVEIPAEKEITDERKALYNTANRTQRIRYAHQKYKEGYTTQEIAYLLHAGERTISTCLSILEDEIPENRAIVRERQHQEAVAQK